MTGNSSTLPDWFRQRLPACRSAENVVEILDRLRINTVCESAECPNRTSCYSKLTATFMILGNTCTRNCTFCAVPKGSPAPPDPGEAERIGQAVRELGLKFAVITSVTRDDLPDGGDRHFAAAARAVRRINPGTLLELLIPDIERADAILGAAPEVIGHNLETVPRFYPELRPGAEYRKSLRVLERIKKKRPDIVTKSGIMLGLGETKEEIGKTMDDLLESGCDVLTLGQYLRPSRRHFPVREYISPEAFVELRETALAKGFKSAAAAPLVRSSYMAHELFAEVKYGSL